MNKNQTENDKENERERERKENAFAQTIVCRLDGTQRKMDKLPNATNQ